MDKQELERFLNKVKIDPLTECWNWTAYINQSGYGRLKLKGKGQSAHRVSFKHYKYDPGDLFVCHKCDNRKCVNPDHLFAGTAQDNSDDMVAKGRWNAPPHNSPGSANANSKLDDKQVEEICSLLENGYNNKEIAALFNVTHSNISLIKLKKKWTHLDCVKSLDIPKYQTGKRKV